MKNRLNTMALCHKINIGVLDMNKNLKRYLILFAILALGAISAHANFNEFNQAGSNAQDVAVEGIKAWTWIVGFIPLGFGIFSAFKMNEYLNQKDESGGGQTEPKATRYAKVLGAGIVGVLIIYMLLGLFGMVFANKSFSETWDTFVIQLWSKIF